jgi:pimeloyl-ACP methyl ester carboxylesterase
VDQRGTGGSNGLYCTPDRAGPIEAFLPTLDPEQIRSCRKELERRADLRYYLTSHAMDDLDELRAVLGFERVVLVAVSYGTRAALEYIRRHGEHVEAALLEGATPFGHPMPLHMATDSEAALRNVLRDCAAEARCAEAFPDLEADYRRAVDEIERAPRKVRIEDPRNGESVEVVFAAAHFAESLRSMLYSPGETQSIPLLLHNAATGDYAPFAEHQVRRNMGLTAGIAQGMYFALTCTEDVARVDPDSAYAAAKGTFLSDHRARPHIEGCEGWPRGRLPAGFGDEVASDVPALFITGAHDPVTPPAAARLAASRMRNARVVIVPFAGHSRSGLLGTGCLSATIARFLATADLDAVDTSCLADVRRQLFHVPAEETR